MKGTKSGGSVLPVSSWSVSEVAAWLKSIKLGVYADAFFSEEIDGEFLVFLDDEMLQELGITKKLHRFKFSRELKKLVHEEEELKLASKNISKHVQKAKEAAKEKKKEVKKELKKEVKQMKKEDKKETKKAQKEAKKDATEGNDTHHDLSPEETHE